MSNLLLTLFSLVGSQLLPGNCKDGDIKRVLGHSWRERRCAFPCVCHQSEVIIIIINRIITIYGEATVHLPSPLWSGEVSFHSASSQVVWSKEEKVRCNEYFVKNYYFIPLMFSGGVSSSHNHLRFSEDVTHCLYWRNFTRTAVTHSQMHLPLFICMSEGVEIFV